MALISKEVFMADENDLAARQARAAAIREQISNVVGGQKGEPAGEAKPDSGPGNAVPRQAPSVRPPSPREFIERRMRELDSGEDAKPGDPSKDKIPGA
jgi:hypothetical protein